MTFCGSHVAAGWPHWDQWQIDRSYLLEDSILEGKALLAEYIDEPHVGDTHVITHVGNFGVS